MTTLKHLFFVFFLIFFIFNSLFTVSGIARNTDPSSCSHMVRDIDSASIVSQSSNFIFPGNDPPTPTPTPADFNETIIIDNKSTNFSVIGSWSLGTNPGYHVTNYSYILTETTESATAAFSPTFKSSGFYEVFTWFVQGSNRPTDAKYVINHKNGTDTVFVDQTTSGSQWLPIGMYEFDASGNSVVLSNESSVAGKTVIADAVRFVRSGSVYGDAYQGMWIYSWGLGFLSEGQTNDMIATARDNNLNCIFPEVRKIGDSYYASATEPRASNIDPGYEDPLEDIIAKAHDTSDGKQYIEVHAWIVPFRVWVDSQGTPPSGHVLNEHPEWMSETYSGSTSDGSRYLDPGVPEVTDYLVDVVLEIVQNYDVDGIHWDYIRYMGPSWGYNPTAVARFNALYGKSGKPATDDPDFCEFRRNQIMQVARKVYAAVKEVDWDCKMSAALITWLPSPPGGDFTLTRPYYDVFQDWPSMMLEGSLDLACPMNYMREHDAAQKAGFRGWTDFTAGARAGRHAIIGPGVYLNSIHNSITQLLYALDTPGIVGNNIYVYHQTNKDGDSAADFWFTMRADTYNKRRDVPLAPWLSSPSQGILCGNVTTNGTTLVDGGVVTLSDGTSGTMTSDGTGFYAFLKMDPGTSFTATAQYPGYLDNVKMFDIHPGVVTTLDFDMVPTPTPTPTPSPTPTETPTPTPTETPTPTPTETPTPTPTLIADFYASPTQTLVFENISFIDQSIGSPETWEWDFGDLNFSDQQNPVHFYDTPGTYTISLSVWDSFSSDTKIREDYISVLPTPTETPTPTPSPTQPPTPTETQTPTPTPTPTLTPTETPTATPSPTPTPGDFNETIIIDNKSEYFSLTGTWETGNYPGYHVTDYNYILTESTESATATFSPTFKSSGFYEVFTWYVQGPNRPTDAKYVINHKNGTDTVLVDQTTSGSQWMPLGMFEFDATGNSVMISNESAVPGKAVIADAVRFMRSGSVYGDAYQGMWIYSWGLGILSEAQTNDMIATARGNNLNCIFPEVRKTGDSYYISATEPRASNIDPDYEDPLADIIAKAHDTSDGKQYIEVHAWIVPFRVWVDSQGTPPSGHVLNEHPEWMSETYSGSTSDGSWYLDPGVPEVADYLVDVVLEIVQNYDVDGIHWDYIRYMGTSWGYNPTAVARFNALYGKSGKPNTDDPDFCEFRRDQILQVARKVYAAVKNVKWNCKMSASLITWLPSPPGGDFTQTRPYYDVFQDWPSMMSEGSLDLACPMNYMREHDAAQKACFRGWTDFTASARAGRHAIIGPGVYLNSIHNSITQILYALDTPGIVGNNIYVYHQTNKDGDSADDFWSTMRADTYNRQRDVPLAPWLSSPTQGILKGIVSSNGTDEIDGAAVTLSEGASGTIKTDGTGFYAFLKLDTGTTFTATVSATGFPDKSKTFNISEGVVTTLNFDMNPTPPDPKELIDYLLGRSDKWIWDVNDDNKIDISDLINLTFYFEF